MSRRSRNMTASRVLAEIGIDNASCSEILAERFTSPDMDSESSSRSIPVSDMSERTPTPLTPLTPLAPINENAVNGNSLSGFLTRDSLKDLFRDVVKEVIQEVQPASLQVQVAPETPKSSRRIDNKLKAVTRDLYARPESAKFDAKSSFKDPHNQFVKRRLMQQVRDNTMQQRAGEAVQIYSDADMTRAIHNIFARARAALLDTQDENQGRTVERKIKKRRLQRKKRLFARREKYLPEEKKDSLSWKLLTWEDMSDEESQDGTDRLTVRHPRLRSELQTSLVHLADNLTPPSVTKQRETFAASHPLYYADS